MLHSSQGEFLSKVEAAVKAAERKAKEEVRKDKYEKNSANKVKVLITDTIALDTVLPTEAPTNKPSLRLALLAALTYRRRPRRLLDSCRRSCRVPDTRATRK